MAKLNLADWETEEISAVYGIVSEVSAAKLCYHLNATLGLKLNRAHKDKSLISHNTVVHYPYFIEENEALDCCWYLISNRNPYVESNKENLAVGLFAHEVLTGKPLVQSLKMIDYFFWCSGLKKSAFDSTFNVQLKSTPYVRALQKLNVETYKGLDIITHN